MLFELGGRATCWGLVVGDFHCYRGQVIWYLQIHPLLLGASLYPGLHTQVKDPSLFTHSCSQPPLSVKHSFTSLKEFKVMMNKYIKVIQKYHQCESKDKTKVWLCKASLHQQLHSNVLKLTQCQSYSCFCHRATLPALQRPSFIKTLTITRAAIISIQSKATSTTACVAPWIVRAMVGTASLLQATLVSIYKGRKDRSYLCNTSWFRFFLTFLDKNTRDTKQFPFVNNIYNYNKPQHLQLQQTQTCITQLKTC